MKVFLNFRDVLIRPKFSNVKSRSIVNLDCIYVLPQSKQIFDGIPIFSSNMTTTGTQEMGKTLSKHKMFTCLSKGIQPTENKEFVFPTFGLREEFHDIRKIIEEHNPKAICLDVANGYLLPFHKRIFELRMLYPSLGIIAGNVCTKEGVQLLAEAGADIVKIGIGPGSVCSTRMETGVGVPQLSSILECVQEAKKQKVLIMSDGGIQQTGDIAKAFLAGAHFVMMGRYFSGTEPCLQRDMIYGMSSEYALTQLQNTNYRNSEGFILKVEEKKINDVLRQLKGSLASTCTYLGQEHLQNIIGKSKYLIRVSNTK